MLLDDIGQALLNAGIGQTDANTDWMVYKGYIEDQPARAICIYETPGEPPYEGQAIDLPHFQVRVRADRDSYQEARTKLQQIYNLLHSGEASLGPDYVYCYAIQSGPMPIGRDENRRPALVQNYRVMKTRRGDQYGELTMTWRGAYSGATSYSIGDGVSYAGSSYIATTITQGHLPTDTAHWDLLAAAGAVGPLAAAVMQFGWEGGFVNNEPPDPQNAPAAGVLNATTSKATAKIGATSDAVFIIYNTPLATGIRGQIGTLTFGAGGQGVVQHGVFAYSTAAFARGDYFEIVPPATADLTLFGVAASLAWD